MSEREDEVGARRYRFLEDGLRISEVGSGPTKHYVVEDPKSERQHRLYDKELLVAQLLDGKRSVLKVAQLATKRSGRETQIVDVDRFAQQLIALGFVERVSS